ncbi:shikimate dehydrogenase family protein [Caballeronia cordobensis]|uniref:shikimate dehydrogenase family protein n=1 Tax=Caballeronia cordobensis TaxID=1353886 RepID=UPI00045EE856|nr:shikimate dehydrogenase substrate binding domain protein [Burkholderia sp. RPE67]
MITGKTGVFFIVADPIEQVRLPEIFNHMFEQCGVDAVMVPLQVTPENLAPTVRYLFRASTTRGIVLSIPHKTAGASIVDRISKGAKIADAVNAIRRGPDGALEGDLFDGVGFLKSMDRYSMDYRQKSVLLIGAGGAGSAIAAALAEDGASSLGIFDPDTEKSSHLSTSIERQYGIPTKATLNNDPAGFDVVINASPLGLQPSDPIPVPADRLKEDAQVCDILMKNQPTPLLRAALDRGLKVLPGFDMLILQSPLFLDFFTIPTAAEALRRDDSVARDLLFPAELRDLVARR